MRLSPAQKLLLRDLESPAGLPIARTDPRVVSVLTERGLARRTLRRGKAYLEITDAGKAAIAPKTMGRPRGYARPAIELPGWVPRGHDLIQLAEMARAPGASERTAAIAAAAQVQVVAAVDEALRLSEGWRRPAREALQLHGDTWARLCCDQWVQETLAKYPQRHGELGHRKSAAKTPTEGG